MKYKAGDKVRIRSKEWYESHKNKFGKIWTDSLSGEGVVCFDQDNAKYCGKEVIIFSVESENYVLRGIPYKWTDEMIEGPSTSKYNKGDFVGVYGYETDVRIEEVRWDGASYSYKVYLAGEEEWLYDDDIAYKNDKMIEGLVEEAIKPKFKIGDKISNGKESFIVLQITSNKYIIEDNLGEYDTLYFDSQNDWGLVREKVRTINEPLFKTSNMPLEKEIEWSLPEGYIFKDENGNVINATKIILENKTDKVMNENNTKVDMGEVSDGYHTFNELYEYRMLYNAALFNEFAKQGLYDVHKSRKHSDGKYPFGDSNWFIVMAELPTGQISNHYEIKDWDKFQIPEKPLANKWDGHSPKDVAERLVNFTNPKKKYTKTYEECCKILGGFSAAHWCGYKCAILITLQKLLICRDAYWKIAGEEMGLGKPWKPNWEGEGCYVIVNHRGNIVTDIQWHSNAIFAFPTEEMRDAFYENFKELIEFCKEFL